MLWAALAGAGSSLLDTGVDIWSAEQQFKHQKELQDRAHQFSAGESRLNRSFQEMMSSTAYQRSMHDLQKAGLNPMLAMTKGQGASTPSGSAAAGVSGTASKASSGGALGKSVSTALEARRLKKDLEQADASIKLQNMQTDVAEAQRAQVGHSALKTSWETKKAMHEADAAESQSKAAISEAELRKKQAEIDKKFINLDNTTRRVREGMGIITGAAGAAKGMRPPGGSRLTKEQWEKQELRKFNQRTRKGNY